ncbi:hypothetical protein ESZ36_16180 [Colwellia demingiae]|uniref:Uncharacterized protein n=1 Tax=Colwellia demingiae TaxID=89401 RepID=A0A5C6QAQ0_9GAMM|nr:hypothetical protein [Colwellia demingiae]TWX65851.1 hypothetical protein ESZ36_16180 [Colwellia demingiae]
MYIWKVSPLIEQLKSESLSQKEQLKYFLTYGILMTLATDPLLTVGLEYGFYDAINTVIMSLMTIIGVVYCYKVNKSTDDKDFILRFVTLGLPITVRLIVLTLVIGIFWGVIDAIFIDSLYLEESETYQTTIVDVSLTSILIVVYYYYFASKLKLFAK